MPFNRRFSLSTFRSLLYISFLALIFSSSMPAAFADVQIGFRHAQDVFECTRGDKVNLEASGGAYMMQWQLKYKKGGMRVCTKKIEPGMLSGMNAMTLHLKSDRAAVLWFQVNESSGEGFYKLITPQSSWEKVEIRLDELILNEDKVVDGKLEVDKIAEIHVIDASALDGSTNGKRTVWFADWRFTERRTMASATNAAERQVVSEAIRRRKLSTGKVGLAAVPVNFQDTEENVLAVLLKAEELGVQILGGCGMAWNEEIEPAPGVYNWSSMDRFFSTVDKHGFRFEFACDIAGVFFHEKVTKPKHVKGKSFRDADYARRYKAMLKSFLERSATEFNISWVHAEGAFSYFRKHADHFPDYLLFLSDVRKLIQDSNPHIRVGVNTDPHNEDDVLSEMAKVTDFMGYDVIQHMEGHVVRPTDLEAMVKRLIRLSAGKSIAMQNAGWGTSHVDNSNDDQQVEFIQELYRVLFRYREKIEYASFYYLYDEDLEFMRPVYDAMFPELPDDFVQKMVESNGRFGVFRTDGSAKPGWYELKKQIAAYYEKV